MNDPSNTTDSHPSDDAHDALIDRVLTEALGEETPPDLKEKIMRRNEDTLVEVVSQSEDSTAPRSPSFWRYPTLLEIGVAATFAGVMCAILLPSVQSARESARRLSQPPEKGVQPNVIPEPVADSLKYQESRKLGEALLEESVIPSERSSGIATKSQPTPSFDSSDPQARFVQQPFASAATPPASPGVRIQESLSRQPAPSRGRRLANGVQGGGVGGGGAFHSFTEFHPIGRPPTLLGRDNYAFGERYERTFNDNYAVINENAFVRAAGGDAVSTFSIDVDTASYANVRQFLDSGQLPPANAVRIEELVNYFPYDYQPPAADSEAPFSAAMEVAPCPWAPEHRLVRIGLKGREVKQEKRPLSNLVFLIDVSGSMSQPNKLPLVVHGLKEMTRRLGENDRVAIVVYASQQGLVLDSTPGDRQREILSSLERLAAGGSTAGGAGIQLAYEVAEKNFIKGGVNRVVLCTDGDFNVGLTSTDALVDLVQHKAQETGVFLSVLGFGRGNLNDAMMEGISGKGNGNYSYVDSEREARKVLVEQMSGTLVTIAKDVKIQVEFNPQRVASYRLIGYENRMLKTEDFKNDKKDAGEIGAGHTVTAIYEIVPAGSQTNQPADPLKYQAADEAAPEPALEQPPELAAELLTLKLRYKQPDEDVSKPLEFPLVDEDLSFDAASNDFRFASAVAEFGLLLRNSQHKGQASYDAVLRRAGDSLGDDPQGYRSEFLQLVRRAADLAD